MTLFGIDVSDAQGAVNWAKVKAAGVAFGIAKATEGNGLTSKTIAANLAGMRAAGLVPGAYHFLVSDFAGATGAVQCDYFLAAVGSLSDAIAAVDIEIEPNLAPHQPTIREIRAFATRFAQQRPNHPLLLYLPRWYWNEIGKPAASDLGPLWTNSNSGYSLARGSVAAIYAGVPSSWWAAGYGGWQSFAALQFSDAATVPGVAGIVDASAYPGSLTELRRQFIDPSIPSTDTGGDTLSNLTVVEAYSPDRTLSFAAGTYTGYHLDGTSKAVTIGAGGSSAHARAKCQLSQDPQRAPNGAFYFVADGGLAGYFVATTASGLTLAPAPPAPAPDCTAAIKTATDPLNAQVAALTSKVAAAKAALG